MNKILLKGLLVATSLSIVHSAPIEELSLGTEDWAPFSFKDKQTNKISGLSTQIIYGTLKLMNIDVKSNRILPWARTQKLAFDGKFDAVYTASINDERLQYMYFPKEPIVSSKWVLFVKKDKKDKLAYEDFGSLDGKKLCLINGYNYPKYFKQYIEKHSDITYTSNEESNIKKLLNNRCDYMPAVLETTLDMVKTKPSLKKSNAYKKIYYFDKPLSVSRFYLMFSKKRVSKQFVDKFSDNLQKFKQTQEYKNIINKYL